MQTAGTGKTVSDDWKKRYMPLVFRHRTLSFQKSALPEPHGILNNLFQFPATNKTCTSMSAHIYKKLEIVGSSTSSIEEAVNNAVEKASKTIRNIRWVEVVETRCHVENQKVAYWQVTIKIGFTLEED